MNFSTKDLVDKFKDYVKITPEGPRVWNQERKLSDKELVGLQLVAQRIASETRDGVSDFDDSEFSARSDFTKPKVFELASQRDDKSWICR